MTEAIFMSYLLLNDTFYFERRKWMIKIILLGFLVSFAFCRSIKNGWAAGGSQILYISMLS